MYAFINHKTDSEVDRSGGRGWLSPAKGLKSKNSVDVETGGNLCLATHCPLLPGSLHSPGYHCSLPSNKYLLH